MWCFCRLAGGDSFCAGMARMFRLSSALMEAVTFFDAKVHRFAVTFFDAKESNQRPQFLPLLSLMPKKVTKEKAPLSRSKARCKIAALRRKRNSLAANVSKLKQPFS